jgi:hypothetical protein
LKRGLRVRPEGRIEGERGRENKGENFRGGSFDRKAAASSYKKRENSLTGPVKLGGLGPNIGG